MYTIPVLPAPHCAACHLLSPGVPGGGTAWLGVCSCMPCCSELHLSQGVWGYPGWQAPQVEIPCLDALGWLCWGSVCKGRGQVCRTLSSLPSPVLFWGVCVCVFVCARQTSRLEARTGRDKVHRDGVRRGGQRKRRRSSGGSIVKETK